MSDEISRREPPHDDFAEQALIAGLLERPALLPEVLAICDAADFYRERHRAIFAAICRLDAAGEPVDGVTLIDALRRAGELEIAGGEKSLVELLTATFDVPAHCAAHARVVRELALRRALALDAARIAAAALDGEGDSDELVARADAALAALRERQIRPRPTTADLVHAVLATLDDQTAESVATGFRDLDRSLSGGFRRGELVILAAPTSRGKSALALNVATRIARAGGRAMFFSLEMREAELARRLVFCEAQIDFGAAVEGLTPAQHERLMFAANELSRIRLRIEYRTPLRPSLLRAIVKQQAREWGGCDLVVCDYIGLMQADGRHERREREVASITRDLKLLAGELDCAVIACAQLNREIARRDNGAPRLSDLRDSGAIEQDADIVLFIHHPSEAEPEDALLIIAKARRGPLMTVPLRWRGSMTRFEDYIRLH
ncbi:AAA family ATPase [bacterium]|nr:AAA family ATPase [bacterium]